MPDESTSGSTPLRDSVLLVTGMLGAGKTTAMAALEDLGWEPIDNFPVNLLPRLLSVERGPGQADGSPLAIGVDLRTRGFDPDRLVSEVEAIAAAENVSFTTLYLDCDSGELQRRFNETRRRHPLASEGPALTGIMAEREAMEPLRQWADIVVNSSGYTTNDLQRTIRELFAPSAPRSMTVNVSSFGFARGMPPLADLVFDMRFLDNPHWIEELRPLTGRDEPVAAHIESDPAFADAFDRISGLILSLLPGYEAQGKAYVNIAFGCTGGKHRSVYSAEKLSRTLTDAGYSPHLLHRNLDTGTADLVEGAARR